MAARYISQREAKGALGIDLEEPTATRVPITAARNCPCFIGTRLWNLPCNAPTGGRSHDIDIPSETLHTHPDNLRKHSNTVELSAWFKIHVREIYNDSRDAAVEIFTDKTPIFFRKIYDCTELQVPLRDENMCENELEHCRVYNKKREKISELTFRM